MSDQPEWEIDDDYCLSCWSSPACKTEEECANNRLANRSMTRNCYRQTNHPAHYWTDGYAEYQCQGIVSIG